MLQDIVANISMSMSVQPLHYAGSLRLDISPLHSDQQSEHVAKPNYAGNQRTFSYPMTSLDGALVMNMHFYMAYLFLKIKGMTSFI